MKEAILAVVGVVAFLGLSLGLLVWLMKVTPHESKSKSSQTETNNNTESVSSNSSIEHKLDRLYDVMNHIRWIGISIGCMFAITFMIPQCTGG